MAVEVATLMPDTRKYGPGAHIYESPYGCGLGPELIVFTTSLQWNHPSTDRTVRTEVQLVYPASFGLKVLNKHARDIHDTFIIDLEQRGYLCSRTSKMPSASELRDVFVRAVRVVLKTINV